MARSWKKQLTAKELAHLKKVAGVTTLAQAEANFKGQAEMRERNRQTFPENHAVVEPCWECKAIARKLGFPI